MNRSIISQKSLRITAWYDSYPNDDQVNIFNCTNPDPQLNVIGAKSVTIWLYGSKDDDAYGADVRVYYRLNESASWSDGKLVEFPDEPYSAWRNVSWIVNENCDLTNFQIRIQEPPTTEWSMNDWIEINAIYAEITVTPNMTLDIGSQLVSSYVGHENVMRLETYGQVAMTEFYNSITPIDSGAVEFWMCKDSYANFEFQYFFTVDRYGYIYETDVETMIRNKPITMNEWNHYKVDFDSDTFDLYLNGVKIGDDIDHDFTTNLGTVNFSVYNDFLLDDPSKFNITHCYIDAIDYSWETDYYPYRSYAFDYSLANITTYTALKIAQVINTSISTDLSENVVEMSASTHEAIFSFTLDLTGVENPNVNISLSVDDGFTLNTTSILNTSLNNNIDFKVTDTGSYEYPFVYYIEMNITLNDDLIFSEDMPFRLPHDKNLTFTQLSIIYETFDITGNYTATYDFLDDAVGGNPAGWTVYEPAGITVDITASVGDHYNVLEIEDNKSPDSGYAYNDFSDQTSGTVDFWFRTNDSSKESWIIIEDNALTDSASLKIKNGKFQYLDNVLFWQNVGLEAISDTWYHIKINFNCTDAWYLWIDGIQQTLDGYTLYGNPIAMDSFKISTQIDVGYSIYLDAVGYSWDNNYIVEDNKYTTDTFKKMGSSKELTKGDIASVEFISNTYSELTMTFLNNSVEQEKYLLSSKGYNDYIQIRSIILNASFYFDEIHFSSYKENYFDVFRINIIDADVAIGDSFNPINVTNYGNAPEFIEYTLDNGSSYIESIDIGEIYQLALNTSVPNSVDNIVYRSILYSEAGLSLKYIYRDNFKIDGICITSIKNGSTHSLFGNSDLSDSDELFLNIIPEESLSWRGYSINGNDNITFSGNSTIIPNSLIQSNGNYSIQVFGNNSVGTMFASEIRHFNINYPITLKSPLIDEILYNTMNNVSLNMSSYIFDTFSDMKYSLDGRSNVSITTQDTTTEHVPYGERNIIVYGDDIYGDEYSSGLITFEVALVRETPSQPDGFTFTNGTLLEPYGDLQFIDGNYSSIRADCLGSGSQNITTTADITREWSYPSGTHYDDVDDLTRGSGDYIRPLSSDNMEVDEFELSSFTLPANLDIYKIIVWVNVWQFSTASSQPRISWDDGDTWSSYGGGYDYFRELGFGDDYGWEWTGLEKGQADLDELAVSIRASGISDMPPSGLYIYCVWVEVYYGMADLDFIVDLNVNDTDLYEVENLRYSHKTNISATIDLDIWNWGTSTWYELESVDNSATFDYHEVTLGNSSDYLNLTSNGIRLRYQAPILFTPLQLEIDCLTLLYSTTFIPGNLYEIPIQPDNFTMANGTLTTYGDLLFINGNYSVVKAELISGGGQWSSTMSPDGDVSIQWSFPSSGTHYDLIDDDPDNPLEGDAVSESATSGLVDEFTMESVDIGSDTVSQVKVRANVAKAGTGDAQIDLYFDGSWQGWKSISSGTYDYIWTGLSGDQTDVNNMKVKFKSGVAGFVKFNIIFAFEIQVYTYEAPNYEVRFQVDLQVDNEDCFYPYMLSYSHKTNISETIDLDIWNWDTNSWYEIESVDNSATFDMDYFWLEYQCAYVNETNGIRIRFQSSTESNSFQLEIDQLRLEYYEV